MGNNPFPVEPAHIGIRLGHAERQRDAHIAAFAGAVEQYLADLAEDVPLPEAQLGHVEGCLDDVWRSTSRIADLQDQLADHTRW